MTGVKRTDAVPPQIIPRSPACVLFREKERIKPIGLAVLLDVYKRQLGIKSPLAVCGLTKKEVKTLAKKYGISTASRPSAPCMATRLPYGARLDYDLLKRIEEGEEFLRQALFSGGKPGNVRLRIHGDTARPETDAEQFAAVLEKREAVSYTHLDVYKRQVRDGLNTGEQKIQPHGHGWSVVNNADQWFWE